MNPITFAINQINHSIPYSILDTVFLKADPYSKRSPVSLDSRIEHSVIRSRVMLDCNIVGGIHMTINVSGLSPIFSNEGNVVYRIPKSLTDNKTIISVLSIMGGATTSNSIMPGGHGSDTYIDSLLGRIDDSITGGSSPPYNARMEVIGENTILLKYTYTPTTVGNIRVVVANDENMQNISTRSYAAFSELCLLATKSYIYNKMIIIMDEAILEGGHNLGAFNNYIQGFADSEELYKEYLKTVWMQVSFMNDGEGFDRFIKSMINPAL